MAEAFDRDLRSLSRETVARGASSARGGRELHAKRVGLYSVRGLHAKVYIFDKSAIVGSANLSQTSTRLVEAGVLITDTAAVRGLRVFAERLRARALPLNSDDVLNQLSKLEPKQLVFPKLGRVGRSRELRLPLFDNDPVWLCTAIPDEDETTAETKAKAKHAARCAEDHGVDADAIHWMNECSRKTASAISEHDYIYFWRETTNRARKAKYGWLDGPWQSLGGVDLGERFGVRRYCVPHVARKRRLIALDHAAVKGLATVLGRSANRDLSTLFEALDSRDPIRLSTKMLGRLLRFLKRHTPP